MKKKFDVERFLEKTIWIFLKIFKQTDTLAEPDVINMKLNMKNFN